MVAVAVMAAVLFAASLVDADTGCYTPQQWNRTCGPHAYKLPSTLFGTKTSYAHATGLNSKKSSEIRFKGCKPILLMLFMRHTTRYPNKKDIRKFNERLPLIRDNIVEAFGNGSGYMCDKHISWLEMWEPQWNESDENQVTKSGIKETEKIATRLQKMFPKLLRNKFSLSDYSIQATTRIRTQDTASAFLRALLKEKEYKKYRKSRHAMSLNDSLLSFNSVCEEKLEKQGVKQKESEEEKKFLNSTEVRTMVEAVSQRTGVNLSIGDVKLMAKMCAFEVAHEGWSPFCHVFDGPDLDLLEYAADLEDYEEDAYGDERNAALACVLFEEMVEKIRAKLQWEFTGKRHHHGELKASLYFTHAGPMKRLFAGLGLGKSEPPLRAEDYCGRGRQRSWRSSRMAPFSANFALVLFQCRDANFYVLSLLNEQIIKLPGCRHYLCPLRDFLTTYAPRGMEKCDLDRICRKDWKPSRRPE
ncbi:multiple inositol polyphosphate phosphatase 1-like [Haemaphysalis longicornis]